MGKEAQKDTRYLKTLSGFMEALGTTEADAQKIVTDHPEYPDLKEMFDEAKRTTGIPMPVDPERTKRITDGVLAELYRPLLRALRVYPQIDKRRE